MHYKDGTPAELGDFVKGVDWQGKLVIGQITSTSPGSTTCNIIVAYTRPQPTVLFGTYTAGEFELVAREDGSVPTSAAVTR